jgi:hypothetical protein
MICSNPGISLFAVGASPQALAQDAAFCICFGKITSCAIGRDCAGTNCSGYFAETGKVA